MTAPLYDVVDKGTAQAEDLNQYGRLFKGGLVYRVAQYGSTGSGVDGYDALAAAVADLNAAGCGTLVMPPVLELDRYVTATNGVTDITIQNCNGVRIVGDGRLSVKGVNRDVITTRALIGLKLQNCKRVIVDGLEIDGNADEATNSGGVTEAASHNLALYGCRGVALKNLWLHHSTCDGLYFDAYSLGGGLYQANQNVIAESVICENNARQGMSPIHLRYAKFTSCAFNDSGLTEGSYGGHAPMAGVDIEPIRANSAVDATTGVITFGNSEFRNNQGQQFVSVLASMVDSIKIDSCDLIADTSPSQFPVALSVNNGTITDSHVSCTNATQPLSAVYPVWGTGASVKTTIRNTEIRGNARAIVAAIVAENGITIEDCHLISELAAPVSTLYFPHINVSGVKFRDNTIFIPSAAHPGSGAATVGALLQNLDSADDNFWNTDLVPSTTEHFWVDFTGTGRVSNQRFTNDASKPFRPASSASWDTSLPYGTGISAPAQRIILNANGNARAILGAATAIPTTGTNVKGDRWLNTNAAAGQPDDFVTVTSGTPGTIVNGPTIGAT